MHTIIHGIVERENNVHFTLYNCGSDFHLPLGSHTCGGSLIRNDIKVTAAHCQPR